jgi:hemoglobin
MTATTSAYDRLGGAEGVDRLIEGFYDRVRADPELAPFFEHADMGHLLSMQHEFVATALGGTESYSMGAIHDAHAGRGIRGRHFVRFLDCFLDSLKDSGLGADDIDRVLERMALAAPDIIDEVSEDG